MTTVTLQEFLKTRTQAEAAEAIGVTPGAIWQMVRAGRRIELTIHDGGRICAIETRPIGKSAAA